MKKDEDKEVKRSSTLYPVINGLHNLVDTKRISKEFGLEEETTVHNVFLDLLVGRGEEKQYLTDPNGLYPVMPTTKNISGPYLTPRKHLEYCTFWAGTSAIGFSSILYVLFKLK